MGKMRRAVLLFTIMALALVGAGGTAFAALVTGTDGPDNLTGTNSADEITGKAGDDTLKGLAGNDTYHFDDGWGTDVLDELATQRVKKKGKWKTVSGGSDTLDFSQMDQGVFVTLVRQWGPDWNQAISYANSTSLGLSTVENATGGRGADSVYGGSETNTLQPGGGGDDELRDFGGLNDGSGGKPELPASNDVFKGFESNTGTDRVYDWGGTADVLDLRPFSSSEVHVDAVDLDGNGTRESLQIVTGTSAQVIVVGQFGEYLDFTSRSGQQGRIEQLLFGNGAFISGEGTASASSKEGSADSVEALIDASKERAEKTPEGAKLEKAAEKLLEEAKKYASEDPMARQPSPSVGEGEG